jgi:putative transposase
VYNKILSKIKADPKLNNNTGYKQLNKECITKLGNNIITKETDTSDLDKFIYDWELETPKDIRNGALRDIKKAYKTAFSNLKNGNINHFGLGFRMKRGYKNQSMEVPASAIKLVNGKRKLSGVNIYVTYLPSVIKFDKKSLKGINLSKITHDTRLKKENNEWYLCIPMDIDGRDIKKKEKTCALDPGIRKFQTIYSEDAIINIIPDFVKNNRILDRLDKIQALKDKKIMRKRTYNKIRARLQSKLTNLVDEMHYKTIRFLTSNYTSILLPSFESQDMVMNKSLSRKTKRNMMNFSFYKFKQRLQHKCDLLKHCNLTIVNEAYTSQTCGFCGHLNPTKDEMITCASCHKVYDRDVNGSRNIYIKYIKRNNNS